MELFDKDGFPVICRECERSCYRCPNIINGQSAIRLRERAAGERLLRNTPLVKTKCVSF